MRRGFLVLLLFVILFAVRSVVADWNNVSSGSMMPSLLAGDRVLINKLAYDLRLPFTLRRIAAWRDPQRGDIVTFSFPGKDRLLVKRIIGTPGDTIAITRNRVYINGEPATYTTLDGVALGESQLEPHDHGFAYYLEEYCGTAHAVMFDDSALHEGKHVFGPAEIPAGEYLVLGDNRDYSEDSRSIGFISRQHILGRACCVAFSLDSDHYYLPRADRFFVDID